MKLYLAGPMTGITAFNFPAFNDAAERLRASGHVVFNPAETDDGDTSLAYDYYMRQDIRAILEVDAIAILPGWQQSKGATLEVSIGRTLGLPILEATTLQPYYETAVQEAQRLVHGQRGEDYGHPADDFTRTGLIWAAILGLPTVTAEQVALCMVGLKISREVNRPRRDNRTDGAGYFETLEMIHHRKGTA